MTRRRARVAAVVGGLAVAVALLAEAAVPAPGAQAGSAKLREDLAALVAGEARLDSRLPKLIAGYRPGELAYFAVLREPNDAAHEAQLTALGARVLRRYRSVDAFALASSPTTVLRVAALPWVDWLAPVEVVTSLDHEPVVAGQSKATTGDVGAPSAWATGITGSGVRIAVLDTGLDALHPDLDDLDFRHWQALGLNAPKVVDARDFNGGACKPLLGNTDFHGHGTHVAGIAAGTGEGTPTADDNAKVAGIAPDAQLAIGKALTDAGAGVNSDLVAAMEWAAMPADPSPAGCSVGAQIVNMSLGSEARPNRLNSGDDIDFVSFVLNRLAVRYGTLFVAAAGNSGPYIGSMLEAPGSAAQALSVGAGVKDYDLVHDETQSGDSCAGWGHDENPPNPPLVEACGDEGVLQPSSLGPLSSRGPSGDVWLRPDVVAPGLHIVSAQASAGALIASGDAQLNTRADPLYATAAGTSMAAPATAGSAALLLQAYREAHDEDPSGASGVSGLIAPAYVLLRASLMNTAGPDLYEARWILRTDFGSAFLLDVRQKSADPYVGPLGEGAGKISVPRAIEALRDSAVIYSAAAAGPDAGTDHRDFQGSWQVGPVAAGTSRTQSFVLHAAPDAGPLTATFAFEPGQPSDGSTALPAGWVTLPGANMVARGGDTLVTFGLNVPAGAPPGMYTGRIVVALSDGRQLRVPVFASVSLHDADAGADEVGPQGRFDSATDVYGKADTEWPSVAGQALGAGADWLVFPVELAPDLSEARFSVYDVAGADTYDLYLYDERLDLVASTHPFVPGGQGVTDMNANDARGPSIADLPQRLTLRTPAGGRHYLVVNRARPSGVPSFGAFKLDLDEIRVPAEQLETQLAYEGDFLFTQGQVGRVAARLTDTQVPGAPIAGRGISFAFDGAGCCSAVTDYRGLAQTATGPVALTPGVHDVSAAFAGDTHWFASTASAFVVVVGTGPPGGGAGGHVTAGGWFPSGAANRDRVHFAFHAQGGIAPPGELRYRDAANGVDVTLVAYSALAVSGNEATLTGTVRHPDGRTSSFALTARDVGDPGKGSDTIRFRLLDSGYDRSGTLGGGNVQVRG